MKLKKSILCLFFILFSIASIAQKNKEEQNEAYCKAKNSFEYIRYDSAIILYNQAADIFKKNNKQVDYFNCQVGVGQCYIKKNEFQKALFWFKDIQNKSEKQFGKNTAIPATCIYYQGYANLYLSETDKAESQIAKSLELRHKIHGENHPDVAQSYNLYGQFFLFKGNYAKSLENFDKSRKIREKIYGAVHPDVAHSLNNISSVYYYKGYLDTAISLANKSLKIKEQSLTPGHPDFILSYNSLAIYQNEKMNYPEALALHQKNLALCEKYYGQSNPITATIYNNIGVSYLKLKDYKQSLNNFEQSVQIRKWLSKTENPDIATTYLSIGDAYDGTFQFDKSVSIKKQALEILIKTLGEYHPNTATAHNSLAISLKNSGNFTQSLEHTEKALTIFNQLEGEKSANSAMCLLNMGVTYSQLGQNEQSLKYYERALFIYQGLYGEESYESGILYNNIGELYIAIGEYTKAVNNFNKSMKINEAVFGQQSQEVAILYKNIGNCEEFSGNLDVALQNYQLALNICKETIGDNHLTTAVIYENISKIYFSKSDFTKAKDYTEKAFEIRRALLPGKHYLISYSLNDMGQTEFRLGNYMAALGYYTYSLENNLRDYTPAGINVYRIPEIENYQDLFSILTALKGKVLVFIASYRDEKQSLGERKESAQHAFDHIKACDHVIDILRKTNFHENDKFAISSSSIAVYDLAVHFCNLLYNNTKEQKYIEQAFYYAEKLKAVTLLEAIGGAEAKKFGNVPDSIISQEKNLDRKIATIRKQIAEYNDYSLYDALFDYETRKQNLIQYCEKNYPKYFELKYADNIPDIKEIQATFDKNTALISYYQTNAFVYQFILTKTKIELSISDKFENFDQKIEEFRYSIIHGNIKENTEEYNKLAYQFYELLFPRNIAKEISNLIIVPAGNLANIPFEALLTSKIADNQKFKVYPYLINKYKISYAYSANLYYLTLTKQKQDKVELSQLNDWLAFAPVFSDESTLGISMQSRGILKQINANIDTLKTRGTLLNGNYVSPLPGTENEVKAIFNEFDKQNKKAEVKIYQSANEEFVKSNELKNYKYIHFATHGFVDSEKPELSGILLAQDTTGGNDGILFSGEIYNLELNADLVALSACETGMGKVQSGEGIIGLTRALLYAGAKNIIVSLWQVSDEATSQLMIEFYSGMLKTNNQQSFSEYLRNAKLKLIKDGKFSHPFFWSPFILIGK